jgi:hypothetical protein
VTNDNLVTDTDSHVWWALRAAHRLAYYEVTQAEIEIASRTKELKALHNQLFNARQTKDEIAEFAARSGWRLDLDYDQHFDANYDDTYDQSAES